MTFVRWHLSLDGARQISAALAALLGALVLIGVAMVAAAHLAARPSRGTTAPPNER